MQNGILLKGDIRSLAGDIYAYGKGRTAFSVLLMISGGLLEGIGLAALLPLFSIITNDHKPDGGFVGRMFSLLGVSTTFGQLAFVISSFVVILIVRALVLTKRDFQIAELQLGYVESLQVRLVKALGAAHWQDVETLRHARITQALGGDIARVTMASQLLMQVGVSGFMLVAQWLAALLIAPKIAGIALMLAAFGGFAFVAAVRRSTAIGRAISGGGLSMMNTTAQLLGGLKLSMAQNMQPAFIREFAVVARDIRDRRYDYQRKQALAKVGITTTAALAGAAILLVGFWLHTPLPSLLAAFAIFGRMNAAVVSFVQTVQLVATNAPAYDEFKGLLSELEGKASENPAPTTPAPAFSGNVITFDKVTYGNGGPARLSNLDLEITRGQVVGITGPSGSGKTTFVDLLTGLVIADSGAIRIDGKPLDRLSGRSWRNHISYVTQDSYLINASIRENLSWGQDEVDDAELWSALALAGADALVRKTEHGLDTVVSERGARFSGGERQRIALARALLRNPEVLILDEATNAIDIETECMIFDRLTSKAQQATIIVVAHRPSTLNNCDRVLTFENGGLAKDELKIPEAKTA